MKECTRYAPMLTARDGELAEAERGELERHLAGCGECRAIRLDLRAVEGLVGFGLTRAAAGRDFGGFADGVMGRLGGQQGAAGQPLPSPPRTTGREMPRVREGVLSRLGAWFRAHRALAIGTALAPVAVAALVLYLSLQGGAPDDDLDVVTEGRSATVLRTNDGPVILIGDGEPT